MSVISPSLFALAVMLGACQIADAQPARHRAQPAVAQQKPVDRFQNWTEPTSFLGVELGQPIINQSVIVPCPMVPLSNRSLDHLVRDHNFKGFCWEKLSDTYLTVHNEPTLVTGYSGKTSTRRKTMSIPKRRNSTKASYKRFPRSRSSNATKAQ